MAAIAIERLSICGGRHIGACSCGWCDVGGIIGAGGRIGAVEITVSVGCPSAVTVIPVTAAVVGVGDPELQPYET